MIERLVLVGFMCSGKSTVGRLVAERLDWDFIDFDEAIERNHKQRIAEIFRDHGENHFRVLEAELTAQMAGFRDVVLAPGGGWVTQPVLVDKLRPGGLVVWLRIQPEAALERHLKQATVERPLLAVDDPLGVVRSMLSERRPLYEVADAVVETDSLTPDEVAAEIVGLLGRHDS